MPTYGYVCSKCGHEFELFQSMTEDALTVCPRDKCGRKRWGKGRVKRQVGAGAGLIFKGSGFYITDYRSDSYKQGAKKDAPPKASDSGKSSSGGDSKSGGKSATPSSGSKGSKQTSK